MAEYVLSSQPWIGNGNTTVSGTGSGPVTISPTATTTGSWRTGTPFPTGLVAGNRYLLRGTVVRTSGTSTPSTNVTIDWFNVSSVFVSSSASTANQSLGTTARNFVLSTIAPATATQANIVWNWATTVSGDVFTMTAVSLTDVFTPMLLHSTAVRRAATY